MNAQALFSSSVADSQSNFNQMPNASSQSASNLFFDGPPQAQAHQKQFEEERSNNNQNGSAQNESSAAVDATNYFNQLAQQPMVQSSSYAEEPKREASNSNNVFNYQQQLDNAGVDLGLNEPVSQTASHLFGGSGFA